MCLFEKLYLSFSNNKTIIANQWKPSEPSLRPSPSFSHSRPSSPRLRHTFRKCPDFTSVLLMSLRQVLCLEHQRHCSNSCRGRAQLYLILEGDSAGSAPGGAEFVQLYDGAQLPSELQNDSLLWVGQWSG